MLGFISFSPTYRADTPLPPLLKWTMSGLPSALVSVMRKRLGDMESGGVVFVLASAESFV